MNTTTTTTKIA